MVGRAVGFEGDALDEVAEDLVEDADGFGGGGEDVAVAVEEDAYCRVLGAIRGGGKGWKGRRVRGPRDGDSRSEAEKLDFPTFLPARARGSMLAVVCVVFGGKCRRTRSK